MFFQAVGRTFRHWVSPVNRRLRPSLRSNKSSTQVTRVSRKGVELAFFSSRGYVVRTSKDGDYTSEYLRLRESISQFVPSAAIYAVSDDRNAILEEFLVGDVLAEINRDSSTYLEALTEVTDGHMMLVRTLAPGAELYSLPEPVSPSFGREVMPFSEYRARVLTYFGKGPLIPSHGDLHSGNMMVHGEHVKAFDFGAMKLRPAWFDAVRLVQFELCRAKGSPGATALLETHLLSLFEASMGWSETPADWRRLASLAYLAWRTTENPGKVKKDWGDLQIWVEAAR